MRTHVPLVIGVLAAAYAIREVRTGGILPHNWFLMPPNSYIAALVAILALLVAAFEFGRTR